MRLPRGPVYVVDGHNVMGQHVGWHRNRPRAQRKLLADLARLSRNRNEAVTVVFDGSPLPGMTDGCVIDGVTILFAHPGSSADDRLIEWVRKTPRTDHLLAVTSDKQLVERLLALGVKTVRSGRFRRLMEETADRGKTERGGTAEREL